MILCIDTTDAKKVDLSLEEAGKTIDSMDQDREYGSQVLLPMIEELLKKNRLNFKDLTGITFERGPGSFTGLKVGAAVANALAFTLGIPVNGKKLETDLVY